MHGYTDFLSVDIRVSYRWFPRNRVGAFILRSEASIAIRSWRGSGVNFILDNCDAQHFNLAKICDFKKVVIDFNEKLKNEDNRYLCLTGDLSNMYTSLDHTSIRRAIRWLLFDTKKQGLRDRRCVSVPKSKSDPNAHFGRAGACDKSYLTFTYDYLVDIINFDLNNSFFAVGPDFVLQQTSGIPMGSPLSPALAVIVCAYYEHKIQEKISERGWSNMILGTRYMDDLLSFVTHDGSLESKSRARRILNWIKFGYHRNMSLECENTMAPFKFLSSTVTANSGSAVSIKYFNKNSDSIKSIGTQKFLTFQHYGSLSPHAQKLSVVISSLHRICMNSLNLDDFLSSVSDLCLELDILSYPPSLIEDALKRIYTHPRFLDLSSS